MASRTQAALFGLIALLVLGGTVGCGDDGPNDPRDVTPPGRVVDLRAGQQSATTGILRWTASGDDEEYGRASSYELRRATSEITLSNWPTTLPLPGAGAPKPSGEPESLLVSGLVEGVKYYFALRLSDEAGNESRLSNTATLTIDVTPPGAVDSLEIRATGATSVELAWKTAGDDGDVGVAAAHDVRYATAAITEATWSTATQVENEVAPVPPGTWQNFAVTELLPATTYWFALKVVDEMGNVSALSDVVQATTRP